MIDKFFFIKSEIESVLHAVLSIKSQKGVTMIEYGLLAALIAVAAIVVVKAIGTNAKSVFSTIASSL